MLTIFWPTFLSDTCWTDEQFDTKSTSSSSHLYLWLFKIGMHPLTTSFTVRVWSESPDKQASTYIVCTGVTGYHDLWNPSDSRTGPRPTMDAILKPANGYVNDKNELTFKVLLEVSDWLEMKFSMTWAPKSSKSFLYCCLYLIRFVLLCYQKSTSVLVSTNNDAHRKTCFRCCHIQYCKLTRCVLVLVYKVHYSAAPIHTSSNCGVGNFMLRLTQFLALQVSAGTGIACLWTLSSSVTQAPHIASYYKVRTYVGKYLRSSVRSSIMTLVKTSQPLTYE